MKKSRLIIPLVFLLTGLFYFFEPVLSSWLEIVNPDFARTFFLPLDFLLIVGLLIPFFSILGNFAGLVPDIFFLSICILYIVYFFKAIRYKWPDKYRNLALAPILIVALVWIALLPLGLTFFERGANAYPLGGQFRLIQAGGSSIVKEEAISFMESVSQSSPPSSEWPPSLQKLGYWVKIEHDNELIIVGIGRMFNMADEFGFIIQKESYPKPNPQYFELTEHFQLWEFEDGVYFFQRP